MTTYSYATFTDPLSSLTAQGTFASGINASGVVAGYYWDSSGNEHGFIDNNGTFTDLADTLVNAGEFTTFAQAINASGQVIGTARDFNGSNHGFIYSNGTFTDITDPSEGFLANFASFEGTNVTGINASGVVVGYYSDNIDAFHTNIAHGFIYNGTTFTNLSDPSAGTQSNQGTFAQGINASGEVVGFYYDTSFTAHGFIYNGTTFTDLNDSSAGTFGTTALGINDSGLVVGKYVDSSGSSHGFIYNGTTFTNLTDPNEGFLTTGFSFEGTTPVGINASGEVVGYYVDKSGNQHGFVYSGGTFTTIDPTGSGFTAPQSINDSGQVAGYFGLTSSGTHVGFLGTPTITPTITNVASTPASGSVGLGQTVKIDLTTNENVTVIGAPTLTLSDGGIATYDAAHSNATTLEFDYLTKLGQNTAANTTLKVTALTVPVGSSIKDGAGNAIVVTGAANADLHLTVDTIAPTVTETLKNDTGVSSTDKFTTDPTLSGTGDANATVSFTLDGNLSGTTATANGTGVWTFLPPGLADGNHTIVASETDAAGNIGTASLKFTLDTTAPTVGPITSSPASGGNVGTGGATITLNLGEAISVVGTPTLIFKDGETANFSAAASNLANGLLAFTLTVPAGKNTADLVIDHVNLPAGVTVKDLAGNAADFSGANNADLGLKVDTTPPTITGVASTPGSGGAVHLAQQVVIDLTASEAVTVVGAPTLTLSDKGIATYDAVHSTSTDLKFDYAPLAGQNTLDLQVTALVEAKGGSIKDLAGNLINPAGAAKADLHLTVDTIAPTVTESLKNDTGASAIDKFTTDATLTGTGDANATVTFTGDVTGNTVANSAGVWTFSPGALADGAHTITASESDAAGNIGSATLKFTLDTKGPVLSTGGIGVSPSSIGTGGTATITLNLEEAVSVTGTPTLVLSDGETATFSTAASNLAGGMAAFTLKAAAGTNQPDLSINHINMTGVTIKDLAGNSADVSATAGFDLKLAIDTVAPTITSVTTPLTGTVPAGQTVEIDLHASEAVKVTGIPTLALSDKGVANYVSGSGTNTLVFDYVVAAGQNTADLLTTSLKNAKGGTITDLAGNVLNLTGAAKQDLHLVVDTIAPLVSSVVSSPSTGAVAAGADVLITLNLNDKATVTGSPTLGLSDGATAAYVSGSGTNALIFKYHVGSESTTDLQVTGINQSVGNTITDAAGNKVSSTLVFDTKDSVNVFTWAHAISGDWNTGANWSPAGGPPVAGNTALISLPGTYTVTSAQNNSLGGLSLTDATATLDITAQELDITSSGTNAGTIKVENGAALGLGTAGKTETFTNSGTISLNSTGNNTILDIVGNVVLTGAGTLALGNGVQNIIQGSASSLLTNVSNTIVGAGQIVDDNLSIDNQAGGVINGNGKNALTIDVGTFTNEGKLEATAVLQITDTTVANSATGSVATLAALSHVELDEASITGGAVTLFKGGSSIIEAVNGHLSTISGSKITIPAGGMFSAHGGDLTITTAFANSGILDANNGHLTLLGAITGKGVGTIEGTGELEFGAAKSTSSVTFGAGATGELTLDHSTTFKGTITGFSGPAANSFSSFFGFGDSTIDSGWFPTALANNQVANETGSTPKNTLISNAVANGGTGTPVGLGNMNSQILAGDFGLTAVPVNNPSGGTNFAIAGAVNAPNAGSGNDPGNGSIGNLNKNSGLHSTVTQITDYLTAHSNKADANALFLISSGGNDITWAKDDITDNTNTKQHAYLNDQAQTLANAIKTLQNDGAQNILIHSNTGQGGFSTFYNNALFGDLDALGVTYIKGDAQSLVAAIEASPTAFGFTAQTVLPGNATLTAATQTSAFQPQTSPAFTPSGWGQWGANTTTASSSFAYLRAPNAQFTSLFSDDQHLSTIGQQIEANFDLAQLFIAGAFAADSIDLKDIPYAPTTLAKFSGTATSGTLTISDGAGHTASLTLSGADYRTAQFVTMDDGSGGTLVIDPPAAGNSAAEIADNPLSSGHYDGAITAGTNLGMIDFSVGRNISLSGDGTITLSSDENIISDGRAVTLTNHETIAGGGVIGDADLTLVNGADGVIDADSTTDGMLISTPAHVLSNAGVIEATAGGWLVIAGTTITDNSSGLVQALDVGTHLDLDEASIKDGSVVIGDGATIDTVDGHASTISGAHVVNAGTLAAGFGDLTVHGGIANSGTLSAANGSHFDVTGAVTGGGSATIFSGGKLEFGKASDADVSFLDATGSLQLDHATTTVSKFIGTVTGFHNGNDIDLGAIDFATVHALTAASYATTDTGGILTVTDGTHTEAITFVGAYHFNDFQFHQDANHYVDLLHV